MKAILFFDGSAAPSNPGHCTAGAVLITPDDTKHEYSQFMGTGTNNSAEFGGLILGLTKAIQMGVQHIEIYGDSDLVVKCSNGDWNTKQAHLYIALTYAKDLLSCFESWSMQWIPREHNIADALTRGNLTPEQLGISSQATKHIESSKKKPKTKDKVSRP
jgi:ribonuclease HI